MGRKPIYQFYEDIRHKASMLQLCLFLKRISQLPNLKNLHRLLRSINIDLPFCCCMLASSTQR